MKLSKTTSRLLCSLFGCTKGEILIPPMTKICIEKDSLDEKAARELESIGLVTITPSESCNDLLYITKTTQN